MNTDLNTINSGHSARLASIAFVCSMLAAAACLHAEQLADPTRPVDAKTFSANAGMAPKALHVEAIYCCATHQRRLAIVDGKLVHEGDHLANALIEVITADAVGYSRDGRRQLAQLNSAKLQVRRLSATQFVARADDQVEKQP